jgi:hypothetical protein
LIEIAVNDPVKAIFKQFVAKVDQQTELFAGVAPLSKKGDDSHRVAEAQSGVGPE